MFNLKDELGIDFANTPWGEVLLKEVEDGLIDSLTSLEIIANSRKGFAARTILKVVNMNQNYCLLYQYLI